MAISIIPLTSLSTYYTFTTVVDNISFVFTIRWNSSSETWYLDMESSSVQLWGVPLISGADILKPFAILEMGSMYVIDLSGHDTNPTRDSLGDPHILAHLSRGDDIQELLDAL